jgi:hypothetical protein
MKLHTDVAELQSLCAAIFMAVARISAKIKSRFIKVDR